MVGVGPSTRRYVDRLAGNLLKVARADAGMSQRALADSANVPQSTIARIESGTRQPSLPALARIVAAIGLELRITLAPYDNHDDVLDSQQARLSPDERAARIAQQDSFAAALNRGASRKVETQ